MILGKKNMSLIKNKKILEYFYKKYFLKIKANIRNTDKELLDICFNNCTTSYTKNLEEIDFFFYDNQKLEENLKIIWETKNSKEFNLLIKILTKLDTKLSMEKIKEEISESIYVMY